jgi:oligopeptide transport system substrate-binding protein
MFRLLTIPLAIAVLLAGALVWSGGGTEKRADFTFINRGDIYTLDLNQMSYMQDFRLTYGIREGLYGPDPQTFRPVPAGATGYELSDDKKVWTFHLRPGAKWSNGDPVTSRDYVFSWRRMLEEPGEYTYLFYYIKNAQEYEKSYTKGEPIPWEKVGIAAPDDLTLRVTLVNPVTYLLELLAFPPFYPRNERSMEPFKIPLENGKYMYRADYTRPAARPDKPVGPDNAGVVTNGPYELTRWDYKRRLLLRKSPTYWDRANVKSDTIEMVVSENVLNQFLLYEAGSVDWVAEVLGDLPAELKAKGRKDLRVSPAFGTFFITFLCRPNLPQSVGGGKNPLADVRVRQALAMATDKQFVVDNITRMGELPARTYLPPDGTLPDFRWLPGPYDKTRTADQPYAPEEVRKLLAEPAADPGPGLPYNIEAARKLLAEAGYPGGRGFPPLPILFNTDSPVRNKIAESLKTQWRQALGIEVNLQAIEGKIFKERVSKKDYAIATVAWYGDYPDISTFTDKYKSDSLQNDSDWISPAFDSLLEEAAKEGDAPKRVKILSRAENMIDTEVPILPIYHYVNVSLNRDNVHGVEPNPRNLTIFKAVSVDH